MSFEKERFVQIADTFEKWWNHELERPIIQVTLAPSENNEGDYFASSYRKDILETCYDLELPAAEAAKRIDEIFSRIVFLGDGFPFFYMRPTGVMGAYLGQEYALIREQGTVWFKTTGQSLEEIAEIKADFNEPLLQRSLALTRAICDQFDGRIAVGVPDLGGMMDIVSGMRDPNELLMDLCEDEDAVKAAIWNMHEQFKPIFRAFCDIIDHGNVPGYTCWATMLSQQPYYVLQNDFSAMIGPDMFDEFYLPVLKKECQSIPRTIYHLDGPAATRHLDSILTVLELDGVQWLNGAGAPGLDQWPEIYKKIRNAGKLCQVFINGSQELHYIDDIVDILGSTKDLCFICTGVTNERKEFEKYLRKYQVEY